MTLVIVLVVVGLLGTAGVVYYIYRKREGFGYGTLPSLIERGEEANNSIASQNNGSRRSSGFGEGYGTISYAPFLHHERQEISLK